MLLNRYSQILFFCLLLFSSGLYADEIEYVVTGVGEPMSENVLNHVSAFRIGSGARLNSRLRRRLVKDTEASVVKAMRPFGYFNPEVSVDITSRGAGKWLLSVDVAAGPPVIIEKLVLDLSGPGSALAPLQEWYKAFPLKEGGVLNQQAWDQAKQAAVVLLEESGYLRAGFRRHVMRVDPVANLAWLELLLDTGPQAIMGEVTFNQDLLEPGLLDGLQRFKSGDPYNAWLLGEFRLDLWRSGYFDGVEVVERRELDADPPRVDFEVNFEARKKNTYQALVGYGTDTQARLQLLWSRHLLSPRGDKFDIRFGWQQKDNEFALSANYRLPRKTGDRQFWIASLGLQSEKQALEVSASDDIENRFDIARGSVDDYWLRLGKVKARNMRDGYEQLFETVFIQYLNETRDFSLTSNADTGGQPLSVAGPFSKLLNDRAKSLLIGMDWDWPEIRGSGFNTVGHHQRAWVFTSNKAWGSDDDFTQVFVSSRWNLLAGERWKFLLRAEAGYSNATTTDIKVPTDAGELNVSVSDLPYLYRFKAGGSRSVRGYDFEQLDDNGLGSNNVLTASAEVEFRFHDDWSVAAFFDIGNAFNDWSKPDLKRGAGLGLRWYSLIGALRLDVAQGLDLEGNPWRVHLTIGTPLL
ncbi:MAG: BamA/TamA family outer membrane protein [Gammaproteobacteria bacterium]|nr:BamA/TamA family outer membrane protein [Gammaproteobacteria bacterium]